MASVKDGPRNLPLKFGPKSSIIIRYLWLYVVEGDGSTVAMQLEKWTGSIFEGKEEGPSLF